MSTWVSPHPQPIWWNLKRRKAWSCYINISGSSIAQQCSCQAECFPVAVESKLVTISMTGYGPSCMTMQLLSRPQLSTQENVLIQIGALYKTCTWPIAHLSSVYLSFWPHASLWARPPIAHLFALSICVSSSEVLTPDNVDVWQILRWIFRSCIFPISGNTTGAVISCSVAHNAKISL